MTPNRGRCKLISMNRYIQITLSELMSTLVLPVAASDALFLHEGRASGAGKSHALQCGWYSLINYFLLCIVATVPMLHRYRPRIAMAGPDFATDRISPGQHPEKGSQTLHEPLPCMDTPDELHSLQRLLYARCNSALVC